MRSLFRRFGATGKCEYGGALIEAALTAPVLVTMALGIVELGRVTYIGIETSNAAKAAVSYGAQNQITANDQAGMQAVAQAEASSLPSQLVSLTVSTAPACSCSSPDTTVSAFSCSTGTPASCPSPSHIEQTVTVTVSSTFNPIISLPGLRGPFTIRGAASQKRLQ